MLAAHQFCHILGFFLMGVPLAEALSSLTLAPPRRGSLLDLPPDLGLPAALSLWLHPDKPWPCFRLHHCRCYAKTDPNGQTDGKKRDPHVALPHLLKCGTERL